MNDTWFLIVILAIGFLLFTYFGRMKRRHDERRPGRKNPIAFWWRGKDEDRDD